MKRFVKVVVAATVLVFTQSAMAEGGWGNPGGWGGGSPMMGNPMSYGMNPQRMMGSKLGGRLENMERTLMSIDASLRKLVELEMRKQQMRGNPMK